MSAPVDVVATFTPTPTSVAGMFWAMTSEQQADFFAALDRIAGSALCFQMAAVVDDIRRRSERGDHAAQNGFQTMLAHAQAYAESATEYRAWEAKREIARMAQGARVSGGAA